MLKQIHRQNLFFKTKRLVCRIRDLCFSPLSTMQKKRCSWGMTIIGNKNHKKNEFKKLSEVFGSIG